MDLTSDHHLDIPPIDVSHCVKVTTVAAEPMVVHASPAGIGGWRFLPPLQLAEMKRVQRRTRNFTETDIKDFAAFLEQGMAESIGLVLVFIENWHNWAFESLIEAFPNFPVRLLHEVNGGLKHTMLPVFGDDIIELCYIMDNIDVAETPERTYSRGSMRLGLWEAQRMPIATWMRGQGAFPRSPQRAVAAVFGGSPLISVSDRLFRHYDSVGLRRWKRLNECPYWIYFDTFFIFTNWDSTLEVVRFHLESKERDMFNLGAQSPIFHQTLELHRDASTTLVLQECIRMHRASMKAFQLVLSRLPQPTSLQLIQRRLEDVAELLEFYQSTCATVLEQQRNLLNMTFNLETIGQSQTVMRLNALAFVFLPLSFIASIFGMTTITTPAVWYIPVALPTLIATVGAVFIINRVTDYLQSRKLKKQQKDQSGHKGINWNALRSWLVKTTSIRFVGSTASNTAPLDKALSSSAGPPSQKQPGPSIRIFDRHFSGQQRPDASTRIANRRSPDQQQLKPPTGVVNRQFSDQQQSEASIRILDGHPQGQQQPKFPTGIFNEYSPGQQQLEPLINALNDPSPSQQQLAPSTRIFDVRFLHQQQPSISVLNTRFRRAIDSFEVYARPTISRKRPRSPEDAYNKLPSGPENANIKLPISREDAYIKEFMGDNQDSFGVGAELMGDSQDWMGNGNGWMGENNDWMGEINNGMGDSEDWMGDREYGRAENGQWISGRDYGFRVTGIARMDSFEQTDLW